MDLLTVQGLCIDLIRKNARIPVVSEVGFIVRKGEIFALVGESGCGKSISCLALTGLLDEAAAASRADSILFCGNQGPMELVGASEAELRKVRGGGIAYIFQEPAAALNPVFRIGDQIAEAIQLHRPKVKEIRAEILHLLEEVGIPDPADRIRHYPHELSGGMQQRVMIAMALASNPELLIADEPTTALDVTIQSQILRLIKKCCTERQMGVILVTHNLGIVAETADRVAVMYAGRIAEEGSSREILTHSQHPYTQSLLAAVPVLGGAKEKLSTIPGSVPPPEDFPKGCRFFGRCRCSSPDQNCSNTVPRRKEVAPGHFVSCFAVPRRQKEI